MKSKFKFVYLFLFTLFVGLTIFSGCDDRKVKSRDLNFYNNGEIVLTINTKDLEDKTLDDFTLPEAPFGYKFDCFMTSSGFVLTSENVEDFAENSTETEIYLQWVPIEYLITWDMGGIGNEPAITSYCVNTNYLVVTPEAEGYYFEGWTYEGCEYPIYDLVLGDGQTVGDITYYANWKIRDDIQYKIETYFEDDYYDDIYNHDYSVDQYLFATYNEIVEFTPKYYSNFTVNEDLSILSGKVSTEEMSVLKVYYQYNRVAIKFDPNNGEELDEFNVRQGLSFSYYNTPTKTGYTLSGWVAESTSAFYEGYSINYVNHIRDEIYTAVWTPNTNTKYIINVYKENFDGTFKLDKYYNKYTTTGITVSIPESEALHSYNPYGDYYFDKISSNLTTIVAGDGSSTINLYYKLNTYTVSFDLDGGKQVEGDLTPLTQTVKSKQYVIAPNVEKEGYNLSYWKDKNGSIKTNLNNWQVTSDNVLIAVWSVKQVEVIFNIYKENINGTYSLYKTSTLKKPAFSTATYYYPHRTTLSEYTNYEVNLSYTTEQNPDYIIFDDYIEYSVSATGAVVSVYYQLKTKTITFDYGCEIDGETSKVYTYKYGQEVQNNIYPINLERDGYTFNGWDSEIVTPILQNQTIKAVWVANSHNITYSLDKDVTNNSKNKESYTILDAQTVISYPTKTGYTFIGWTIDDGEEKFKNLTYGDLGEKDVTLYAHFEITVYTITYEGIDKDTTNENPTSYTILDSFTLKDPVKIGYIFLGWEGQYGSYHKPLLISKGTTGNKTFTAVWKEYEIGEITLTNCNDIHNYVKDIDKDNISLEFFGAKCVGNDGLEVPILMQKGYKEEDWLSAGKRSVTFTAQKNGKTTTKTLEFSVIERPTVNFGRTKYRLEMVNVYFYDYLKTALEVTVNGYAPDAYCEFIKDGVKIDGVPQAGGNYTLKIIVYDLADYIIEETQEIKIYSAEGITATYDTTVTEVRKDHILEDLKVQGFDVTGDPAVNYFVRSHGSAGSTSEIHFEVFDCFNNYQIFKTKPIKIYGAPNISFKTPESGYVTDNVEVESLFVATDSFGEVLDVEVTTDIEFKSTNYVTFTCVATDHLGNTATKTVSCLVSDENFGYSYNFYKEEKIIIVTKYLGNSENVVLPDEVDYIGRDIFGDFAPNVKRITVPNNVVVISDKAFYNCSNLEELSVPFVGVIGRELVDPKYFASTTNTPDLWFDSINDIIPKNLKKFTVTRDLVRYIDEWRDGTYGRDYVTSLGKMVASCEEIIINVKSQENFDVTLLSGVTKNNTKLNKITLPSFVQELPEFNNCSALTSIYPSTNLTSLKLVNCPQLKVDISFASSVTEIPANTLNGCSSIKNIVLSDNTTIIGESAFENCYSLESITLPANLEIIGKNAFKGCSLLKNIIISEKTIEIGENAFENCVSLESVSFPNSLKNIKQYAFAGCLKLKNATLPNNEIVAGNYSFANTAIEYLEVNNISTISSTAYANCKTIKTVKILSDVTTINSSILNKISGFNEIEVLYLPKELTQIDMDSFVNINVLKVEFDKESTIKTIPQYAFSNAPKLKEVVLCESIKTICTFAFYYCSQLITINLENIICIEDFAFYYCSLLSDITLSQNLTTIGIQAFTCSKMPENLIIPESVTTIKDGAFSSTKIKTVSLPSTITKLESGLFYGTTLESINITNIIEISDSVFAYCENLTSVIMSNKLTTIGNGAFAYCDELETIIIPNSVNSIGEYAFRGCLKLKNVTLPTSSGDGINLDFTFIECSALESIIIPANVKLINQAFSKCTSLKEITFTSSTKINYLQIQTELENLKLEKVNVSSLNVWFSIEFGQYKSNPIEFGAKLYVDNVLFEYDFTNINEIPDFAFAGAEIEHLVIPSNVTKLGKGAFKNVKTLKSVKIECDIEILDSTFSGCTSLTEVTLPNGVSKLISTFSGCTSLESITIPDSVKTMYLTFSGCTMLKNCNIPANFDGSVSAYVFYECSSLTSVTLPQGLLTISSSMFERSGLTEITIPDSVTTIGSRAFYKTYITNVTIPSGVNTLDYYVFAECKNLESVIFKGAITKSLQDSSTYPTNRFFYNCTALTSVTFGQGTKHIASGMFYGCASITKIILPETLTTIGWEAFAYTNIENITIPQNVVRLGSYAFSHCSNLKKIKILCNVDIEEYTFEYCTSLTLASDVEFNENIDTLGDGAFKGCSGLIEAPIPRKVKDMVNYVFEDCASLESVIIPYGGKDELYLIRTSTFKNCYNLKTIIIEEGYKIVDITIWRLFYNSSKNIMLDYIYLPSTLTRMSSVSGSSNFNVYNLVYHKDTKLNETYLYKNEFYGLFLQNELYIPEGVTTIMGEAFKDLNDVDVISLPSTLINIEANAFAYISAKIEWRNPTITTIKTNAFKNYMGSSFDMPASVTTVEANAFYNAYNLLTINAKSVSDWAKINFANAGCNLLSTGAKLYVKDKLITSVRIETQIGNYAFSGYNDLTSAYLITTSNYIGEGAFSNCLSLEILLLDSMTYWALEPVDTFINCPIKVFYFGSSLEKYNEEIDKISNMSISAKKTYYYSGTRPEVNEGIYFTYINGVPTPWTSINIA